MKVAITAQGKELSSALDKRFGRAPFLLIGDRDSQKLYAHENKARLQQTGAGIATAQYVIDQGVEMVVTGEVGPKAAQVLQAAGIKVFATSATTVQEALDELRQGGSAPAPGSTPTQSTSAAARQPVGDTLLAVATDGHQVAQHFGRCQEYTLATIRKGAIISRRTLPNPGHEPDFLPGYLAEQGVTIVIAGGMGPRAVNLFAAKGIQTILGVSGSVSQALADFRDGRLEAGESTCTHE